MAQSFYGTSVSITNGNQTLIYASPAGTTSILHSAYFSNTNTTIDLSVDIQIERAAAPGIFTYLGRYLPIPKGGTLLFDKVLNLLPGDSLYVTSSFSGGTVDANLSLLLIT